MNIVHIMGNIVRTPEVREISSESRETKVVNFTVASTRRFRKKDGTSDEETTFVDCEAWDSGAETISKWFEKGDAIIIHGSLKNEKWVDKDGNNRYKDKVRVSQFEFPPKARNTQKLSSEASVKTGDTGQVAELANVSSESANEELPF